MMFEVVVLMVSSPSFDFVFADSYYTNINHVVVIISYCFYYEHCFASNKGQHAPEIDNF